MEKLIFLCVLFFYSFNACACALNTWYWPIPLGYNKGTFDLDKLIEQQPSFDGTSIKSINIDKSISQIRQNINGIIAHYNYVGSFPERIKGLPLKDFELISIKLESMLGNDFHDAEGNLIMRGGYLLPEVTVENTYNKWIVVFEYKLIFTIPNGQHLFWRAEIITLPDGTILYEYPGMGECG